MVTNPTTITTMRNTKSRPPKGRPALPAEDRKSIVVTVKYDIDEYQKMMDKAIIAGLNRSEYIRHSTIHCKVVPRLKVKDVKAIRDLQGFSENLNQIAKFCNAILRGGASEDRFVNTYKDILEARMFVNYLIKTYRNTPDSDDGQD